MGARGNWYDLMMIMVAGFLGLAVLWLIGWAVVGFFMRRSERRK